MQITGNSAAALYQSMALGQTSSSKKQDAASVEATSYSAAGSTTTGLRTADFSHMSRNQMQTVAKQMYDSGAINADELTSVTLMGPLGWAGPNGEFIPFTESERAAIDNEPMDYNQMISDVISGIESQGRAADPTSGYQNWKHLSSVLQQWQGSTSAANITV